MSAYAELQDTLLSNPKKWLVTGAAGFIGSHLVEKLISLGQNVVGLDSFITGQKENLDDVRRRVDPRSWGRFQFTAGDIRNGRTCHEITSGCDYILHQAALGSVPRSIEDPLTTHDCNVNGFVNILVAARAAGLQSLVYASSSSVYGSEETMPKVEDRIGEPLSPYALTKRTNELYARVFSSAYGFRAVGLRYFNVFGPRQDPNGPYAAVIPKWVSAIRAGQAVEIYGDGETSRDFCFIANVVQANLLAAVTETSCDIFNVACNERTTLNQLYLLLQKHLNPSLPSDRLPLAVYRPFRPGDVRHSLADIGRITSLLGYRPSHLLKDGIRDTLRPDSIQKT